MPTLTKEQYQELSSLSAWDIANRIGIHYSGDCSPIPHGGFFYDAKDWEQYGYANCIEFWIDPDTTPDTLRITIGTIHKPDDMSGAFECCDVPEAERSNIHAQIVACRDYNGIEPDEHQEYSRAYNLETWSEWRIWKSVYPLLLSLWSSPSLTHSQGNIVLPNVNHETGIRYGIIHINSLSEWIWDEIFQTGENLSYNSAWEDYKAENDIDENQEDIDDLRQEFADSYYGDNDIYAGELDGIHYQTTSNGELFVFFSPHLTKARLCSPCVPNCGDLDNIDWDHGYECYDVPSDWRYVPE